MSSRSQGKGFLRVLEEQESTRRREEGVPLRDRRGGCAIKKKAASEAAQTGWSVLINFPRLTTPAAPFNWRLRSSFWMARPPLLSQEGNTLAFKACAQPPQSRNFPVRREHEITQRLSLTVSRCAESGAG
jgi:hypothetical protein